MNDLHRLAGVATILLSVAAPMPAGAQAGATDAREAAQAGEIIVTGSRRDERLADAPVSATVIGERFAREARIDSLRQIDDFVPNVQFNQTSQIGGTYISIRGIESNPFIVNRAAVYVDGVPYRSVDNLVLPAIEQVEILRGPQGTLYGANTESGVIIIRTRAPSDRPEAMATLSGYGFGKGRGAEAMAHLAGPVARALAASLTLKHERADTFTRNVASSIGKEGSIRETYAQGRIRWTPHDRLTVDLLANVHLLRTPGLYELEFSPMDRAAYDARYFETANSQRSGRFERVNDAPANTRRDNHTVAGTLSYAMDFAKLDMNLAVRGERTSSQGLDMDLTAAALSAGANRTRNRETNAEIRFASLTGAPVQWVIGANAYTENRRGRLGTLMGPGTLSSYGYAPWQSTKGHGYAGFGQVTVGLLDGVNLTGGIRYERAKREKRQNAGSLSLGALGSFTYADEARKGSFDEWLPKASIDWRVAPDLLLYASVAKGWIPGGFNLQASAATLGRQFGSYVPETLRSYETGFKFEGLGKRLLLSGSVFHIRARNWQENVVPTDDGGRVLSTTVITADASVRSSGVELELVGKVDPTLDIALAFGYVDANYVRYRYDATRDYSGNRVKLVPEWDASLSASWRPWGGLFLRGEANGTGRTMLDPANRVGQGVAWLLNAQIGWEAKHWSARLFAENLTDRLVYTSTAYDNFIFGSDGVSYATPGRPRLFGVELGFKW